MADLLDYLREAVQQAVGGTEQRYDRGGLSDALSPLNELAPDSPMGDAPIVGPIVDLGEALYKTGRALGRSPVAVKFGGDFARGIGLSDSGGEELVQKYLTPKAQTTAPTVSLPEVAAPKQKISYSFGGLTRQSELPSGESVKTSRGSFSKTGKGFTTNEDRSQQLLLSEDERHILDQAIDLMKIEDPQARLVGRAILAKLPRIQKLLATGESGPAQKTEASASKPEEGATLGGSLATLAALYGGGKLLGGGLSLLRAKRAAGAAKAVSAVAPEVANLASVTAKSPAATKAAFDAAELAGLAKAGKLNDVSAIVTDVIKSKSKSDELVNVVNAMRSSGLNKSQIDQVFNAISKDQFTFKGQNKVTNDLLRSAYERAGLVLP